MGGLRKLLSSVVKIMKRSSWMSKVVNSAPKRTRRDSSPTRKTFANKTFTRPPYWTPPEKKDDLEIVTLNVASVGGQLTLGNGIALGTAASGNRIGRSIKLVSLTMNTTLVATTDYAAFRLLVVYDKQPNGAAPAITDILVSDSIQSPMNLSNSKRFKVIMDVRDICGANTNIINRSDYRKMPYLNTEYNTGNTGTITDITSGALWALAYYTDQAGATSAPNGQILFRVRYIDN